MKSKIFAILSILLFSCSFVNSGLLPPGFSEIRIGQKLDTTAIRYAPAGRVFVLEKPGILNIFKPDAADQTPIVCLNFRVKVDNYNERGAQSMAFDPDFKNNGHIYIYYAVKDASHNRVSRFTIRGDVGDLNSEVVIIELETLLAAIHNGGALVFKDDKLFITTGDGFNHKLAQSFDSLLGKVLRLNKDGSIPTDNPFYNTLKDRFRAIYALGFRNPQGASMDPVSKRIFVNDVGDVTWEEVNELLPGKNYGWPIIEGHKTNQTAPENFKEPLYVYKHTPNRDLCAVVGSAWYHPKNPTFPNEYVGKYIFADYCNNTVFQMDPNTYEVTHFAHDIAGAVSIDVSPTGDLFYVARGGILDINTRSFKGEAFRVKYTGDTHPSFSFQPSDVTTTVQSNALFQCGASGSPLTYQWYVNGEPVNDTNSRKFIFKSPALADSGKKVTVTVTDGSTTITSREAIITVTTNTPPVPTFVFPEVVYKYDAGNIIFFKATAFDNEDGELFEYNFYWKIDFHHGDHVHPGMELEHEMWGFFQTPVVFETASDVYYRFYVTVTDSAGTDTTIYRDIYPNLATVTLDTDPEGLMLMLDGREITTPYTFTGVVGIMRLVEAYNQTMNGKNYVYDDWNVGDYGATYNMSTPPGESDIIAEFRVPGELSRRAILGIIGGVLLVIAFVFGGYHTYKKRKLKKIGEAVPGSANDKVPIRPHAELYDSANDESR